jgi:tetratricopeptide (TPR) repeat protein
MQKFCLMTKSSLLLAVCILGTSLVATSGHAQRERLNSSEFGVPADIACASMLKDYLKGKKHESAPCNESNFEFIMIPGSCPKLVRDKAQKAHALCLSIKATQKDYDDCNQAADVDRGIAGCTGVINDLAQSVADRVAALVQRGNTLLPVNAHAEALSDYERAIKLDPQSILAYAARAIVHWKDADDERDSNKWAEWNARRLAVADYRKAGTIDAARLSEMTAASPELKKISDAASKPTPPQPKKPLMFE